MKNMSAEEQKTIKEVAYILSVEYLGEMNEEVYLIVWAQLIKLSLCSFTN